MAQFTVEQAYSRYDTRTAPYLGTDNIQPVENDLNIELGYCYGGDKIHENPRDSKGRPGTRAPHYWLQRNGEQISTLDLFGRDYVTLRGEEIRDSGFQDAYGIKPSGSVLVRPDGFVEKRQEV